MVAGGDASPGLTRADRVSIIAASVVNTRRGIASGGVGMCMNSKTELSSSHSRRRHPTLAFLAAAVALLGCQPESRTADWDDSIAAYRDRMLVEQQAEARQPEPLNGRRVGRIRPVAWQSEQPERDAILAQPAVDRPVAPMDVLSEIPDPASAAQTFEARLTSLRDEQAGRRDQRVVRNYERVVAQAKEYLQMVDRPEQVNLGLAECIQRALNNNYAIRIEAHNPAISETQIVEAEAAFDAQFFLDVSHAALDQATASTITPASSRNFNIEGGLRKLLPTGAQASVSVGQRRSQNSLPEEFQELNPVWNSSFKTSITQPLLQGFGLDVNRAQIQIRKTEYRISREQFVQKVRDTLLNVENAYWQLLQARRSVAILAISVAQNYVTWQNMIERLEHDATQVEVANAEANFQSRYVNLLETVKLVRDAEDALKNLLNDPELTLSEDIEIIPTEVPFVAPMVLDHFREVRTALDRRSEIRAAKQQIDAARISTNASKNAILPQLDLTFQYEVQGIGRSADNSFDNLKGGKFMSYTVAANFVYNFGERAARAAYRRARLQESQAIVALNQITDGIVQEVNERIRTLMVRYEQIPPALTSVRASTRNLRSLQARTQRIDPSYLQTELSAVQQLSNARSTLLQVIIDYNYGIVQLESAKGTLLDYNNVTVSDGAAR